MQKLTLDKFRKEFDDYLAQHQKIISDLTGEMTPEVIEDARKFVYILSMSKKQNIYRAKYCRETIRRKESIELQKWRQLGKGWFGVAYLHLDTGLVLKVSVGRAGWNEDNKSKFDRRGRANDARNLDGWPVYAEFCKNNPHPYLPIILHGEKFRKYGYWAIMPKYNTGYSMPEKWNAPLDETMPDEYTPDNLRVFIRVRELAKQVGADFDLHSGNIALYREAGYDSERFENYPTVLLDPFVIRCDSNKNPLRHVSNII